MATFTQGLRPPFCPRRACPSHCSGLPWTCIKSGSYSRTATPRRIQRYTCVVCRASFSSQTFDTTYFLKRPDLLKPLFYRLVACSGFRQIAREYGVSHTTVMRLSERLARHCLLFQQMYFTRARLLEPVVIDGLESFAHSQYYPCHINVAVGSDSHFLYAFTDSELRRKGRMTESQKQRRAELEQQHGRQDPRSIEKEVATLLQIVATRTERGLIVRSDDHKAYTPAIARLSLPVSHEVTASTVPRNEYNPLFPVNRLDLLTRHSGANHKRETIAFSKTQQNLVERFAIQTVWMNFAKSFSEKRQDSTPAMRLGLVSRKLSAGQILGRRLFPWRITLSDRAQDYYWRRVWTRPRGRSRPHILKLAT